MRKMRNLVKRSGFAGGLVSLMAGAVLLAFSGSVVAQTISDGCGDCHGEQYNDWKVSGHPYKLMKGEIAQNRPIPLPEGYSWDDISYVIGGYKWKSRYIDNDGYIITNDDSAEGGNTQYNMLVGYWSDYHADEANGTKPYDCGSCHTTNWVANPDPTDLSGNQDMLPGMHGTFDQGGIQCIQCHGEGHPGMIDTSAEACGDCHIRGEADTIPASGGFIRHHEQYNEHLAGAHGSRDCVMCHNPHKKSEWSIKEDAQCGVSCHSSIGDTYALTSMADYGVECKDCHMPYATKSAKALGPHQGDLQTHIIYIDTDPTANMFTEDGGFVVLDSEGKAKVTMDFACQRCHETASLDELALFAKDFHNPDKSLADFGLDPGLSGTWWNPTKDGEGFLLEVDANKFLYASFYTYGPNGEQTWLVAALDTSAGVTANVKVFIPTGGTWGDPSGADTGAEWGIGTFTFPTCTSGSVSLTPNATMMGMGYTAVAYDLERILPSGIACPTFVNNEMTAAMR